MIPEHEDQQHEDYVEYLIQSGQELNGLSLEQLGYQPGPRTSVLMNGTRRKPRIWNGWNR
ncbi:UNVERIFIED_ORG: hypothetical protein J2X79_003757 [Arthrobacter globiformis]|nr:hypothetical protein [Arthrobacter globiformis]